MKFAIQINTSPYHANAGYTAYQFIRAALAQGHERRRIALCGVGAGNFNVYEIAATDLNQAIALGFAVWTTPTTP